LGFALGLAAIWSGEAGSVFWAGEEGVFAEEGAPYPPGLAQFGLSSERLIVVRAPKREEALWASEQMLSAPGAVVVCALSGRGKPLDLKATRRLLLFAERCQSRCLLPSYAVPVRASGDATAGTAAVHGNAAAATGNVANAAFWGGGDDPHANVQPSLAAFWQIKL
jgi:protein ImuA